MPIGSQSTCTSGSAANRDIANRERPIAQPKSNMRASLISTNGSVCTLHPIVEHAATRKPASLFKRFIHFFQCKKPTPPHTFDLYSNTTDFKCAAARQSPPGEKLQIRPSKAMISTVRERLTEQQTRWSKLEKPSKENKSIFFVRDREYILARLKNIQADLKPLKFAGDKHYTCNAELNFLIDTCTEFEKNLNTEITTYIDKQRTLSADKIDQICSESAWIVEKTEKHLRKINKRSYNNAHNENLKKTLNEDLHRCRTDLENAYNIIRSNGTWYSSHEFMNIHNALTSNQKSDRRLNFAEYEKKLAATASLRIPRAALKNSHFPTQSNC